MSPVSTIRGDVSSHVVAERVGSSWIDDGRDMDKAGNRPSKTFVGNNMDQFTGFSVDSLKF